MNKDDLNDAFLNAEKISKIDLLKLFQKLAEVFAKAKETINKSGLKR